MTSLSLELTLFFDLDSSSTLYKEFLPLLISESESEDLSSFCSIIIVFNLFKGEWVRSFKALSSFTLDEILRPGWSN